MPLYEYECRKCKAHFEKIRKFSDPPLVKCENCGGKLQQLISSPAVQFKGSGWYVTDYARKPAGGNDKGEGTASPAGKDGAKVAGKDGSKDAAKATGTDGGKSPESKKTTEPASVGTK